MIGQPRPKAAPSPTGTVTFAFTDIEGSTVRWDRDRAAMQDAVRRHDAVLRAAITRHGGHVFKTIGDAFCSAFARPEHAVTAMLDAQRELAAEDFVAVGGLRVRMALHTGTADEREGDYVGPPLNRVARLLAIAHGGQILISSATRELARDDLPEGAVLVDLGSHRLHDLSEAERVWQLDVAGLPNEFPPLRSVDARPNNLPIARTSFVGREHDITEIKELLDHHRVLTLVGAGGVGKTRLSLRVAADLIDDRGDGVWFVELAPLTNGEYIPTTVAQALGITLPSKGDPADNIGRALKHKVMLLVLDNCEHLVEPVAQVVSALLDAAPNVKLLASSRQKLGVTGEATFQVPSLDAQTGVALFVDRARTLNATFEVTEENATVLAEICRRLDGIPLAIELAAARVGVLGVKHLRDRLDERFRVLTGGRRDALPRQQTLRALIDWSYDLLEEPERLLFRRLGIFVSGFTLEGAVVVESEDGLGELDNFDVLASLIDKSLVLADRQGDTLRYRLLESTRAYALEKLEASGERDTIAGRHLRYLRDRFAELWRLTQQTGQSADLGAALQIELGDVRWALNGALVRGTVVDAAELLASIGARWRLAGLNAEGMARLEAYLAALPETESRLRAHLATSLSFLLGESGARAQSFELAAQAVAHARVSTDQWALAAALHRFARNAMFLDRLEEAERALAEAEAIPGASPNFRMVLLETRACLVQLRGDLESAARMFEEIRRECRAQGDDHREKVAAYNLAEVEHARGCTPRAIAVVRELLPAARSGADTGQLALILQNLAGYLSAVGDSSGAAAAAREAIRIRAAHEPRHVLVAATIEHLALALALCGDLERAAVLESYANAALEEHRFVREFTERSSHEALTQLLCLELEPGELARLLAEGAALTPEAAIVLALEESQPRRGDSQPPPRGAPVAGRFI